METDKKIQMCDKCDAEMDEVPFEFVEWDDIPEDIKKKGVRSVWVCHYCNDGLIITNTCECCGTPAQHLQ